MGYPLYFIALGMCALGTNGLFFTAAYICWITPTPLAALGLALLGAVAWVANRWVLDSLMITIHTMRLQHHPDTTFHTAVWAQAVALHLTTAGVIPNDGQGTYHCTHQRLHHPTLPRSLWGYAPLIDHLHQHIATQAFPGRWKRRAFLALTPYALHLPVLSAHDLLRVAHALRHMPAPPEPLSS